MLTSQHDIVINTGPIIALSIGLARPETVLRHFGRIIIPNEVAEEIRTGAPGLPGYTILNLEDRVEVFEQPTRIRPDLVMLLDRGEASVIQTGLDMETPRVCIDEAMGRRVARLNGLSVTGSLGMIVHAIRCGESIDLAQVISIMRRGGIWIAESLVNKALSLAGQ
jgi:predicted nucleic acid-binding protein